MSARLAAQAVDGSDRMSEALEKGCGFEFAPWTFCVEKKEQVRKLNCSGVNPEIYGNQVEIAMLGLPTIKVLMAADIPILGGVHLSQRFRQIAPLQLEEPITVAGQIMEINPHPRGCILHSHFKYSRSNGYVCVEAERSGIIAVGAKEPSRGILRPSETLEGFSEITRRKLIPKSVAEYSNEAGNLIHTDPAVAAEHGFRAPIAAGLMGIHFYREALQKAYQPNAFDLEVWFRRPMFWDDIMTLMAFKEKGRICAMHLLCSSGKPASNCIIHSV